MRTLKLTLVSFYSAETNVISIFAALPVNKSGKVSLTKKEKSSLYKKANVSKDFTIKYLVL